MGEESAGGWGGGWPLEISLDIRAAKSMLMKVLCEYSSRYSYRTQLVDVRGEVALDKA